MSPNIRTALIVGGGIAGPIAAMALSRAGIEATVHEAYDSRADGVGGGMSIAPNGLSALDTIGAGDIVRSVGTPMKSIVLQSWTGRPLGEFGTPPGLPAMQFVKRADLYASLYDEAAHRGIRVVHGKRVVGVDDTDDGVTARFTDGTSAGADILIGADGIRSRVAWMSDHRRSA